MHGASKVATAHCTVFASPLGPLAIYTDNSQLLRLELTTNPLSTLPSTSALVNHTIKALNDYFATGKLAPLPTAPKGTNFQKSVWAALTKIPAGKTLTYGELATQLGSSARAIGAACRSNPLPIIIPCHRVTAQHNLGGYMGATQGEALQHKTWLLQREGAL